MFTPNLKVVAETRNKGCITTHAIWYGALRYTISFITWLLKTATFSS